MLWNRADLRAPVHTFYGHTDMVVNFGWRCASPEDPRTRLVTWSKDSTLRLWEIDSELQRRCGHEVEEHEEQEVKEEQEEEPLEEGIELMPIVTTEEEGAVIVESLVMRGAGAARVRGDSESEAEARGGRSMNLDKEFKLLHVSPKLQVVAEDTKERLFTVSAETSKNVLILHVKFPPGYPNQKAPVFSFLNGTTVESLAVRSNILSKVRSVAKKAVTRNRRCLEPCLRQFEHSVAVLEQDEQDQLKLNNPQPNAPQLGGTQGYQDHNIPFPRSSGARFCGDGYLVTFGCSRQYSVPVARDETDGGAEEVAKTPRALTALLGVPTPSGASSPQYPAVGMCGQSPSQDINYFPFKARVSRVRFTNSKQRVSLSDEQGLDRKVSVGSNRGSSRTSTPTVTIYSCQGLMPPGCRDLASSYILPGCGAGSGLSRQEICLRNAAAAAAVDRADLVQVWNMAALSASGCEEDGVPWAQHPMGRSLLSSLLQHYAKLRDVQTVAVLCAVLGNSSPGGARPLAPEEPVGADYCLLDPAQETTYDCYMHAYSQLLYTWRLLIPRTEVTKCLASSGVKEARNSLNLCCSKCATLSPGPFCSSCHHPLLLCSMCRLPCRGLSCLCPSCGHGGHTTHLAAWFLEHGVCPTGCGCPCPSFQGCPSLVIKDSTEESGEFDRLNLGREAVPGNSAFVEFVSRRSFEGL